MNSVDLSGLIGRRLIDKASDVIGVAVGWRSSDANVSILVLRKDGSVDGVALGALVAGSVRVQMP